MDKDTKSVAIHTCDECAFSAHSPDDGLWFCNHEEVRDRGDFINVTQMDGCPFTEGVHKRCPLRACRFLYELADNAVFLDADEKAEETRWIPE